MLALSYGVWEQTFYLFRSIANALFVHSKQHALIVNK